jgi:hypothetical protein
MKSEIALGNVGKLSLEFSGGKASIGVTASESIDGGLASVDASVNGVADAGAVVDLLFSAIEKASPAGAVPIEEGVKSIVKAAVAAIQ